MPARNVVIAVRTVLGAGSYTSRWQWGTEHFEAWQTMAKGFCEFQKFSPESLAKAADAFDQALAIELARGDTDAAVAAARQAMEMAPIDFYCRVTLGAALTFANWVGVKDRAQWDRPLAALKKAGLPD